MAVTIVSLGAQQQSYGAPQQTYGAPQQSNYGSQAPHYDVENQNYNGNQYNGNSQYNGNNQQYNNNSYDDDSDSDYNGHPYGREQSPQEAPTSPLVYILCGIVTVLLILAGCFAGYMCCSSGNSDVSGSSDSDSLGKGSSKKGLSSTDSGNPKHNSPEPPSPLKSTSPSSLDDDKDILEEVNAFLAADQPHVYNPAIEGNVFDNGKKLRSAIASEKAEGVKAMEKDIQQKQIDAGKGMVPGNRMTEEEQQETDEMMNDMFDMLDDAKALKDAINAY